MGTLAHTLRGLSRSGYRPAAAAALSRSQAAAHRSLQQGLEEVTRNKHGFPGAPLRIEVDRLERYKKRLRELFEGVMKHVSNPILVGPPTGFE